MNTIQKPRYGFDAPGVIRAFFLVATALLIVGWFVPAFHLGGWRVAFIGPLLMAFAVVPLFLGGCMVAYGWRGKFNVRELMLSLVSWHGDETVLDVGTGRGLLAIGAAKRLTGGKAVGIDVWNAADLSGNGIDNARLNARLEGVESKVEFMDGDVRKLGFGTATFDVVLSLLCLHNIEDPADQARACREIARVMKPGATAIIADYVPTSKYARALREAGLETSGSRTYFTTAYGLFWLCTATKPV